ncbi:DNA repair exonuclease [Halobacteriales archaeon SW_5_68_122]|nr:MAG: DNA repair exonuclease [Halobacteriales archaeon SW_5_68_122]
MVRVIHTGDTHLGYRQYHLPERREDFLDAFRQVVSDAVESDVDAVVHAGDLFHDRRPGLPDLLGTQEILETLAAADVPFLAVVGNHETKRDAQWLDLFEAMGLATRLDGTPTVVGDTAFYGLDFVPRARRADLAYEFEPHDADHAALVSHGLFEPLVPDYGNVEWDAAEVLAEATVEFNAMLLGDEHAPTRREVDDTWVTYCGSTERASADEREARGYNIVAFNKGVDISRRGIETREFVFVDLELAAGEGFERVRDRLREHDLEGAVVHVGLTGDGEEVSAARIESIADEAGALVARVNDRREVAEETDLEVAFADPDEAVRERVRELGLSEAARDLDDTIRESKVADSNVADETERRVEELLGEPSAFEPAAEEAETVADRLPDESDDTSEETAAEGGGASADAAPDEQAGDEASPEEAAPERTAEPRTKPTADAEQSVEAADGGESEAEGGGAPADDADDQASMEDYL